MRAADPLSRIGTLCRAHGWPEPHHGWVSGLAGDAFWRARHGWVSVRTQDGRAWEVCCSRYRAAAAPTLAAAVACAIAIWRTLDDLPLCTDAPSSREEVSPWPD